MHAPHAVNWPMFRGDATRNATAYWTGAPGRQRWKAGTLDGPASQQYSTWRHSDADDVLFCCLHPLVIGDLMLLRSPRRLTAFDVRTGKQLWENPPAVKMQQTKSKTPGDEPESELWQRFWEDAPYGQLSSNGSEVFLIDGLDVARCGNGPRLIAVGNRIQIASRPARPYNRLVALSLRQEGKLVWSVGGPPCDEPQPEMADSLPPNLETARDAHSRAGYFFLGPPLPHNGQLYVLAEKEGLVRLCGARRGFGKS